MYHQGPLEARRGDVLIARRDRDLGEVRVSVCRQLPPPRRSRPYSNFLRLKVWCARPKIAASQSSLVREPAHAHAMASGRSSAAMKASFALGMMLLAGLARAGPSTPASGKLPNFVVVSCASGWALRATLMAPVR